MTLKCYDPVTAVRIGPELTRGMLEMLRLLPNPVCSDGFTEGEISCYMHIVQDMDLGTSYVPKTVRNRLLVEVSDHIPGCARCSEFYKLMESTTDQNEPVM